MFEKKQNDKGVSSFQALMIATASRVGTGNIAGVATAIMAGGPAYYIEKALHARWLGIIFAVSLIATFAFGFNGLQAYNIVSAFEYYVPDFQHSNIPLDVGIILCVISLILFFGGTEKISWISSILVPIMAGMYVIIGLLIIILNFGKIPAVFAEIFRSAFNFRAIFGGFTGSCMVYGIKRGLFSNETGMGSAPNASASTTVSHPAKQGLAQIISVYIDTLLICSTTVFILLLTGHYAFSHSLR